MDECGNDDTEVRESPLATKSQEFPDRKKMDERKQIRKNP